MCLKYHINYGSKQLPRIFKIGARNGGSVFVVFKTADSRHTHVDGLGAPARRPHLYPIDLVFAIVVEQEETLRAFQETSRTHRLSSHRICPAFHRKPIW